ncbi:apolipoprotein L1 isoform X4 [Alosa alosa]|uniref:apolipoprotein L1 isoform X4 n=1 Tax=Alosa alosa TaxID=278164 RepID=UPI002015465B|nr:apolipoprotein L1 isoform X4 [Alosa alosa]
MEWGGRYETLDLECEEGTRTEKSAFSGMFKRASKISESSGPAQEQNGNLSKSNDNLSDNSSLKAGSFLWRAACSSGGKASVGDNQELSASNDSLSAKANPKEKGGMFSGMFRKSPKPPGGMDQASLAVDKDLSASNDSLSESSSNKEKSGMLSGMFKRPKRTASQDNLCDQSDVSASNDSLSESSSNKEKSGMLSGMFKKSPKPNHKRTASQDNLSDISASSDSLSENSNPKTGMMGKILRNPFHSTAQDKERTEKSSDAKASQSKQEKDSYSETEEMEESGIHSGHKQNALVGVMSKLNPFRHANKDKESEKDDEDESSGSENHSHRKQKLNSEMESDEELERDKDEVKTDQREGKERTTRAALVPPRPTDKERSSAASNSQLGRTTAKEREVSGNMSQRENKSIARPSLVPPKPKEKELTARMKESELKEAQSKEQQGAGAECCDEPTHGGEEGIQPTTKKAKKPKNPFLSQVAATNKASALKTGQEEASGSDYLEDESEDGLEDRKELSTEEKKSEQEVSSTKPKKKKPKKVKNPFMAHVAKGKKKNEKEEGAPGDDSAEGQNKSLFEQLDEYRFDKDEEENKDLDGLMEWWNTVEQWEDLPQNDDMTEKEEAKAFAVTAEKVQKGIRVFNKLFTERAEGLWQHVIDLNSIADGLDRFNKRTKIAQITGGSTSAIGGVATITGLALAPVTFGTSLIITAVGLGVATAGGLTSASAGISNQVNNSLDRKKVERIVEDYQEKMGDLNKCMKFIKQGIENLRRFDLIKLKSQAYNQDFPALNNIYEDGAMAGKAILINANEIMRVVQIANVAGSTAARAVQIASMATGVLTGLFVGMDIYFVAKDSRELKKGAKSEFAGKIREVAEQLHAGLVELNSIREELQSSSSPEGRAEDHQPDDIDDIDEIKRILKSVPPERRDDTDDIDEIKRKLKSNPPPSADDTDDIDEIKRKLKNNPPPSRDNSDDIAEIKRKAKN